MLTMNLKTPSSDKKIIVKKYPNRRLYDVVHSRHLTMEEILSLIKNGYDVEIFDSKTQQDLTQSVLMQVIFSAEKNGTYLFSSSFLHHFIRNRDGWVEEFFADLVPKFLESYMEMKDVMKRQFFTLSSPKQWLASARKDVRTSHHPFQTSPPLHVENLTEEIDQLREQIRLLEIKLKEISDPSEL